MNPLYIIPARGGSKGIPHKNIKPFCGVPLIWLSIDCARDLGADDDHIIVSTDERRIAKVASNRGLPVPYMRPAALGGDNVGSREVILDAMDWADRMGIEYDCVVLLQPTSPLRTADDVYNALALYDPQVDMVVSVCEAASNPYYTCFEQEGPEGYLHISKGDGLYTRRQDCPKVWEYNGAVYVINPDSLRRMPMGAFKRRLPSPMPRERSVDLDTPTDWLVAETLARDLGTCDRYNS
ncbi:MAG: acylneuraminate cytidylyltransferase family protein [Bacteroidales bacterium]|nr:acylneuraminate cytidylyltransferase family protein [Bacteroidales bacterium]